MRVNDPAIVAQIDELFRQYEIALMSDDVAALDELFHDSAATVRYGVGEVLYGADEIRGFRKGRGGSPRRRLGRLAIATYGTDLATTNVEFYREGGAPRGRQSQTWVRFPEGWKIVAAHVSIEGSGS